jgi:hypothetical protein
MVYFGLPLLWLNGFSLSTGQKAGKVGESRVL